LKTNEQISQMDWKNGSDMNKRVPAMFGILMLSCFTTGWACTNLFISKGASADGSTFISYTADSHVLFGGSIISTAAEYPEGAMVGCL
jgi:hypothetical protein